MIGEIGGTAEEDAADFITSSTIKKPMAAFIAGRSAAKGKRMGHAGAIISGSTGKAIDKIKFLEKSGVHIANSPACMGQVMAEAFRK